MLGASAFQLQLGGLSVKTYPSLIVGAGAAYMRWIETVRANAMMSDEIGSLRLKRASDRGAKVPVTDPRVVGRVGVSNADRIEKAALAASNEQPRWAFTPIEQRVEIDQDVPRHLANNFDVFVDVFTGGGHTERFATLEIAVAMKGTAEGNLELTRNLLLQGSQVGGREIQTVRKPGGVVCVHLLYKTAAANFGRVLGAPV